MTSGTAGIILSVIPAKAGIQALDSGSSASWPRRAGLADWNDKWEGSGMSNERDGMIGE